ncbi:hypothetical protein ACIGNX_04930 [Actinosynnema sp. NPDC053489]|uniref:hypothetical protein n=1 Tax=Actinosynnema sp. NPDC053489 TaxID=3363916 RepID=UPI0037CAAE07
MTTTPFEPDPGFGEPRIAAADPGQGAPDPATGFGVEGEEPDGTDDKPGGDPEGD